MKYYLIVGEASGDLHASHLMKELKARDAEADFRFLGGDLMKAQGGTLVRHYKELAYMGFIPVLLHLRTILHNMKACKRDVLEWNPDVLILVDYPGFNLSVAEFVHVHSPIPVYYYISPKIWAWKEYRIKNIKRDVDELFSILPFEVESIIILFTMWVTLHWTKWRLTKGKTKKTSDVLRKTTDWRASPSWLCWPGAVSRKSRTTCP